MYSQYHETKKLLAQDFFFCINMKRRGKNQTVQTSNSVHKLAQSDRKKYAGFTGLKDYMIFVKITKLEILVVLFNFYPGVFSVHNKYDLFP